VPDLHSGRGRFVLRDVQDMLCNSQITDTGITRTCHGEQANKQALYLDCHEVPNCQGASFTGEGLPQRRRHFPELIDNGDILRALRLAFSTFDAFLGFEATHQTGPLSLHAPFVV